MARTSFRVGDVFDRMTEIPDGSIDLVMTSPPFLALRSYLPADHPDKNKEIGSEANPGEFIDTLLALTAEWRRVLAPHGSIAVELGDTYSGSGGAGGDYGEGGWRGEQSKFAGSALMHRKSKVLVDGKRLQQGEGWPLPKSLALIPESYRFGLVYGVNPHTGEVSPAGRWRVRNVVRWVRPNPPVGALGDKFRPATSELVVACLSDRRFFDLDAVRTESGAPPLDWWNITAVGFDGSHYAVYPPELCVVPIKSMCPDRVCTVCGEPSRRLTEVSYMDANGNPATGESWRGGISEGKGAHSLKKNSLTAVPTTVGWTDCGHDSWRPGIVLDPFGGSGTTGMVATGLGRDAILIDIDERNAELAMERIGPLLCDVVPAGLTSDRSD